MLRRTPLVARTPLTRTVGLAPVSERRRVEAQAAGKPLLPALTTRPTPAAPVNVRAILITRSQGWCEIQLDVCMGQGTDASHRKSRKNGGRRGEAAARHNVPSNYLWACRACHHHCHLEPNWATAEERGYFVDEHKVPAQVAVLYRRERLVYLDDSGGIHDYEEHSA